MGDVAQVVEEFIASTQHLPAELFKRLNLMRELDEKSLQISNQLQEDEEDFFESISSSGCLDADEHAMQSQIEEKHKRVNNLCTEKLLLAHQTYDVLDKCITRLDQDLKRCESLLPPTTRAARVKTEEEESEEGEDQEMPVDPDEPVFCICRKVSFGRMIQCENSNCPYEWFHFSCVGLSAAPRGSWHCTHCRKQIQGTPEKKQKREQPEK
eukprot:TRINITY_DN85868_c0_g1_i1.p1 TRINITY_DN85868_c0_g1~~TRINITY_DN85868_c0_g1_i1.p1  ORF type:complete len:211 (+),score=12.56 TRINITY_DN85868_c0_g1_i1:27-659(+)